jgi:predicted ATPase/class 3 adenylate cyclase/DNA-binding SARP family transcriptional activator
MRFGILGPLEVFAEDGVRRDPGASRQRRLLLALLVWRGEPVSLDRLAELVWPETDLPRDPVGALRTYVTRLRGLLEPEQVGREPHVIVGGTDHYTLRLDGHELDATGFERDLARGIDAVTDDPVTALRCLDSALARWRGPALMEVADEHWAMPEAVRLNELRLAALEHRFGCLIETGGHHEAVGELERHVLQNPLRERPHGLLMVGLDRSGRAAEATEVFRDFRDRLAEETGLEPSADLQRLHQRLLTASGTTTFAGTAVSGVWNELPATRNQLIGRQDDLDGVSGLLASYPVVTLTGAGGVGKTRLAVEFARTHPGAGVSVLFADLGRITDGDDVADAVFEALRLPAPARTEGVDAIVRLLRSRPALLVMDNCEHVLDAVAALVERLTRDCPKLTVLATSREPIGLDCERVYRLPSLDTPAAVALFRDRAAAVGSPRAIGPTELHHVEDICRRLDGIPLAIELAATRTAHMTVAEIARHVDERFWLLTGGRRALPRQQTLQATIDWSYDLLDEEERRMLRAAAVFVDGFDVQAVAGVADRNEQTTVDLLASLVGKSLVEAEGGADRARYRLLETVRLYGLDRLGDEGEAAVRRGAHADHFLSRALTRGPQIHDLPPGGGKRTMCRIRLDPVPREGEPDLANHVAALKWFDRHGDLAGLGRLAARLVTVLEYRGFLDPDRSYLGRDDVADSLVDTERTMYLTASALNAAYFGDFAEELRLGRAAMEMATDPATRAAAAALTAQASLAFDREHLSEVVEHGLRDLPEDARFARLLLRGQHSLALVVEGRLVEAVEKLQDHARDGDTFAASELMLVLHLLGDNERALQVSLPEDAEQEHRELWAYRWTLARALASAAGGRHADAARLLLEAADRTSSTPVRLLDRDVLLGCAAAAYHAGDRERSLRLLAAARGTFRSPASYRLYIHYRDLVTPHVTKDKRAAILREARERGPRDALERELERLRASLDAEPLQALATVIFTDIVGSTERAAMLGDENWAALLEEHNRIVREELNAHHGREVKQTGDGFLATFDSPARAVRCAHAIAVEVRHLGVEIRAGVHTGELEIRGSDIGGLAVHVASRAMAHASPGEVVVTGTVRDLVAGSSIAFEDRGVRTLRGVPGEWKLLAVRET